MAEFSRRTLMAIAATSMIFPRTVQAADAVKLKRQYVDCRYGQLHMQVAQPVEAHHATQNPLLCMHPSPASGRYYLDLIGDMGADRIAMAADTPGYGESDRPPNAPPPMEGYAGAFADALQNLGYGKNGKKVDVLGYHTGCIVAVDLAIRRPDLVRKLCLVAVPYYDTPERQQKLLAGIDRFTYGEEADHVVEMWNSTVKKRAKGVTLEQAVDIFLERM